MNSALDLKPCPCGLPGKIEYDDEFGTGLWHARCSSSQCGWWAGSYDTEAMAREVWNRRPPESGTGTPPRHYPSFLERSGIVELQREENRRQSQEIEKIMAEGKDQGLTASHLTPFGEALEHIANLLGMADTWGNWEDGIPEEFVPDCQSALAFIDQWDPDPERKSALSGRPLAEPSNPNPIPQVPAPLPVEPAPLVTVKSGYGKGTVEPATAPRPDLEAIESGCYEPGESATVESMAITALIAYIRQLESAPGAGIDKGEG